MITVFAILDIRFDPLPVPPAYPWGVELAYRQGCMTRCLILCFVPGELSNSRGNGPLGWRGCLDVVKLLSGKNTYINTLQRHILMELVQTFARARLRVFHCVNFLRSTINALTIYDIHYHFRGVNRWLDYVAWSQRKNIGLTHNVQNNKEASSLIFANRISIVGK